MKSIYRVVSTLLLVILGVGIGPAKLLGAQQMSPRVDPISTFTQLKTTLSKLYPIEHWTGSTTPDGMNPFAPRFCWKFFRAAPEILARLGTGILTYKGSVTWMLGPPEASSSMCLIATERDRNKFTGYPPLKQSRFARSNSAIEESMPTQEFIEQALADVPSLCAYLERYLTLEQMPAKSFDLGMVAPKDPPSPESTPIDFVEPGMQVAWILQSASNSGRVDKRMLHFSVAADEWSRIHNDISPDPFASSATNRIESGSFPLLSRIEPWESTYFKRVEVESLRQECLRARAEISDPLAIRGLDKIILICNWAKHLGGDILLRAP